MFVWDNPLQRHLSRIRFQETNGLGNMIKIALIPAELLSHRVANDPLVTTELERYQIAPCIRTQC